MAVRDLIPWGRSRSSAPTTLPSAGQSDEVSPFLTLHREMNRLFDDVFNRFGAGLPSAFGGVAGLSSWPSIEVDASDNEVRVSAEVPGLAEDDIEILFEDNILTIRGEKRSEIEDRGRRFSERQYGWFERSIALPFEVEADKAAASFKNGVLTVTLPKSPQAQDRAKRIPIGGKSESTQH